jgi:hypothetical protein
VIAGLKVGTSGGLVTMEKFEDTAPAGGETAGPKITTVVIASDRNPTSRTP